MSRTSGEPHIAVSILDSVFRIDFSGTDTVSAL